ncbi:hypothetical protein HMPREF1043_0026, partial [Streptococcus anginosus subsp. whileyi CCUG 39159]
MISWPRGPQVIPPPTWGLRPTRNPARDTGGRRRPSDSAYRGCSVGVIDSRRLQVPTHLIGAARFRVRVRGVLSEVRDSVAQHGELRDLLLDLSEAHVKQVAHVLAGRMAAVADVEDLADLGEGEARGLAAVDEVDP